MPLPEIPGTSGERSNFPSMIQRMIFGRQQVIPEAAVSSIDNQTAESDILPTAKANTDVYVKNVTLLFNGAPLQSLSSEDGSRDFDYSKYFLFLRSTGCVQSGFSHGICKATDILSYIFTPMQILIHLIFPFLAVADWSDAYR